MIAIMVQKAFDDVLQYLVEHQAKLVRDNQGRIPYEVIGSISTKRSANFENQIIVSILKSHFEPMMTELKYQDQSSIERLGKEGAACY